MPIVRSTVMIHVYQGIPLMNLTDCKIHSVLFGPHGRGERNLRIRISHSVWSTAALPSVGRVSGGGAFVRGGLALRAGVRRTASRCVRRGSKSFPFELRAPAAETGFTYVVPWLVAVSRGEASGEGRLGFAGGSAPFAEAGFRALSAPKVVALLGDTTCGRGNTTFQEG
jgi:hypothetical protein